MEKVYIKPNGNSDTNTVELINEHVELEKEDAMFYHDMVETMEGNIKFEDGQWAKIHFGI